MNSNDCRDMITLTLHDELSLRRAKKSAIPGREKTRKKGGLYIVRKKSDLQRAHGVAMTSVEAIMDNVGASHWTPNVMRYVSYVDKDAAYKQIKGHSEDNLKAINCFVVDADFGDAKPSYWDFDTQKFFVQITNRYLLIPTYILETPHGYQAYYVLDKPIWLKRHADGSMPALTAAKRVSQTIREAVAKQLPETDTGANHFGFFRMPSETNLVEIYEQQLQSFPRLLKWSMKEAAKVSPALKQQRVLRVLQSQTNTAWFRALTSAQVPCAGKGGGFGRNNVLLTLCLAMYSSGKSEAEAYDYADQWNSGQNQPLKDREVRGIVSSAFSGNYHAASRFYIQELVDCYAPGTHVQGATRTWYKFAKSRDERKNSHLDEWAADLMQLVETSTDVHRGLVRFSVRELQDRLNISKQSLNRLLNMLSDNGSICLRRVRGCRGGLYIGTAKMILAHLQKEGHSDDKKSPIQEPDRVVDQLGEVVVLKRQHAPESRPIDLFLERAPGAV